MRRQYSNVTFVFISMFIIRFSHLQPFPLTARQNPKESIVSIVLSAPDPIGTIHSLEKCRRRKVIERAYNSAVFISGIHSLLHWRDAGDGSINEDSDAPTACDS